MREDVRICSFWAFTLAIFLIIPLLSTAIFVPDFSWGNRKNFFVEYKKYYKDSKKPLQLLLAAVKPL